MEGRLGTWMHFDGGWKSAVRSLQLSFSLKGRNSDQIIFKPTCLVQVHMYYWIGAVSGRVQGGAVVSAVIKAEA